MPDTTLTLTLEGEVTLNQLTAAITHFQKLLVALEQEIGADIPIEWDLEDLQHGSAILAFAGRAEQEAPVERVIAAFEDVAQALQQHTPIPFSRPVIQAGQALTQLIDHRVKTVRLGTARKEAIIYSLFDAKKLSSTKPLIALGTVKGRVLSISSRKTPRFTLYDAVFDTAVNCYLDIAQQDTLADIWDKTVFVSGSVTRQPDSGKPVSVRNITDISLVPTVAPGSYRQARGIFAGLSDEPAEVSIRRLRDAEI